MTGGRLGIAATPRQPSRQTALAAAFEIATGGAFCEFADAFAGSLDNARAIAGSPSIPQSPFPVVAVAKSTDGPFIDVWLRPWEQPNSHLGKGPAKPHHRAPSRLPLAV